MSTEYYCIKESKKEMFHLGSSRCNAELFEELLRKIKSYQKKNLTVEQSQELCQKFIEKYLLEDDTDDDFITYLVKFLVPALMNWVDDSTYFTDEYSFENRFRKEYGEDVCDKYYEEHRESYIDKIFKTVGSIYDDCNTPDTIINFETTFERALTEMKAGKIAYRKTNPDVHYQIENGHLFIDNHGMILVKFDDMMATDWVIV